MKCFSIERNQWRPPNYGSFVRQQIIDFRVIGFIDVDSFECQVWQRDYPEFKDRACIVSDKSGRIVSVSPEAKKKGVTREMRRNEAEMVFRGKENLKVFEKPNTFNKPDSKKTRDASFEIIKALKKYCLDKPTIIIQYTPNDQWLFDLTEYVQNLLAQDPEPCSSNLNFLIDSDETINMRLEAANGAFVNEEILVKVKEDYVKHSTLALLSKNEYKDEHALFVGAVVIHDVCRFILKLTKFVCSAGVGINAVQAKIGCEKNKPKTITVVTQSGFDRISDFECPIQQFPGLKKNRGKALIARFPTSPTLFDLRNRDIEEFLDSFHKIDAYTIYDNIHGICKKPVIQKLMTNSVSCGKNNLKIKTRNELRLRLRHLSQEMMSRLKEERIRNRRFPRKNAMRILFSYHPWIPGYTYVPKDDITKTCECQMVFKMRVTTKQLIHNCYKKILRSLFHKINVVISSLKIFVRNFDKLSKRKRGKKMRARTVLDRYKLPAIARINKKKVTR